MKNLLLITFLGSVFSVQAAVFELVDYPGYDQGDPHTYCHQNYNQGLSEYIAPCYVISTTTSLPTLIIDGVEVDLNSPESKERLEAELRGDIEPVLLNQLQLNQGK